MKKDTIFWDVDTQFDFMRPKGKLYVTGAEAGGLGCNIVANEWDGPQHSAVHLTGLNHYR